MEEERPKICINEIETRDYFYVKSLIQQTQYETLHKFITDNNIDINEYNFLRDVCAYKSKELILFFKTRLQADFIHPKDAIYEYHILQHYAFVGEIGILDMLIDVLNCYDDFMKVLSLSALRNSEITSIYLKNKKIRNFLKIK